MSLQRMRRAQSQCDNVFVIFVAFVLSALYTDMPPILHSPLRPSRSTPQRAFGCSVCVRRPYVLVVVAAGGGNGW